MTMHLVRGMSSLNTKRRRQKKSPGWKQKLAEHDKFLRKMGAHPDQIKESRKRNADVVIRSIPDYSDDRSSLRTSDVICGGGLKKETNKYTGTEIIGIGTMHKSNMVPVSRKKDAEDMAKMRR